MTLEGVDYAWARPSVAGLVSAGKKFVVRYGGPGSVGKQLDAAEARALIEAGIAIVANAEGAADGMLGGRDVGRAWARQADEHFRALGMPDDRPIYLSVDFDAGSAHWPAIDAALRGAAEVLGADRVGVYGGYDTIRHCQSAGTARWFWQTYAWSSGRWASGVHLQQYKNHVSLAGGTVDLCRAMVADYGQWGQQREDDMLTEDDQPIIRAALHSTEIGRTGVTFAQVLDTLRQVPGDVDALAAKVDAMAARVEQVAVGGVDLDALADRVADKLAARLAS